MPFILITFGDAEGPVFDPNRIEPYIDEILREDKPRPPRGRRGEQPTPQPMARKCHVMNKAWIVEVNQLKTDAIVKALEKLVPDDQPFIVAPLSDFWQARNGAASASKCFSY